MTEKEILSHIDSGANFYISMFGNAQHMETVNKPFYSYIRPKADEHGISLVYNIHIDNLPIEQQKEIIAEIKSLNMPTWLDLLATDEVFFLFTGNERTHGQTVFSENDEIYMAMLPDEKPDCDVNHVEIMKANSAEEFANWTQVPNDILAGGYPDMHPVYHYHLCEEEIMKCYMIYHDGVPVSAAATMDNHGIVSLEFVATIPEMRRKGYAKAVCTKAVRDAFSDGAQIVTVRAINGIAAKLYESIGFKAYNYTL